MTSLYRMEDFGSFLMALLAQAMSSTFAFVETERETLAVTEPRGGNHISSSDTDTKGS